MGLNTIKDFYTKEIQDIIRNLQSNLGINFVVVFDLKNQELISFYVCQSILVQDEQNRKTFLIKGKLLNDFESFIQQSGYYIPNRNGGDFKQIIDNLPLCVHTYSENMFGFIGFGIQGY